MPDFTKYTDRELVDNFLDRAAGLSWRLEAEDELKRRDYGTRTGGGRPVSKEYLLGRIALREREEARS